MKRIISRLVPIMVRVLLDRLGPDAEELEFLSEMLSDAAVEIQDYARVKGENGVLRSS